MLLPEWSLRGRYLFLPLFLSSCILFFFSFLFLCVPYYLFPTYLLPLLSVIFSLVQRHIVKIRVNVNQGMLVRANPLRIVSTISRRGMRPGL